VATLYEGKTRSHWREFEFMFHQIQQAVESPTSLNNVISNWGEIKEKLAESTRKRKLQIESFLLS
jgi:uncharacterized protein (DUF1810 family)